MRFERPKSGERRVKTGFAFLPISTNNNRISVWLEFYKVQQYYDGNIKKWVNDYFLPIGQYEVKKEKI